MGEDAFDRPQPASRPSAAKGGRRRRDGRRTSVADVFDIEIPKALAALITMVALSWQLLVGFLEAGQAGDHADPLLRRLENA